ncbi:MAG: metallophosphoesterase [Thermoprotei archaeon]|nr:MAG: metallophosphoesterase [Thermoprotei archaeon]
MIQILATADIHSPRYIELFFRSIKEISTDPDVIILAGDLVERNTVTALKPVYNYITKTFPSTPVVSIFGNEEYRGFEEEYIKRYDQFTWLNDSYTIIEIHGKKIGIVGTRGALDKPTTWQLRNIPQISEYYRELPAKIAKLVAKLKSQGTDAILLVSHYGVTYRNLEGEPRRIWMHLASRGFEELIKSGIIDLVIHGHVHKGRIERVMVGSAPVYNVSLPARSRIVNIEFIIESKEKTGIYKWL